MKAKEFAAIDPRYFDGDPYDVAEQAVAQLKGLLSIVDELLEPTMIVVRNAHMERNLANDSDPGGAEWPSTAEGMRWQTVVESIETLLKQLSALQRSAAFNPRALDAD